MIIRKSVHEIIVPESIIRDRARKNLSRGERGVCTKLNTVRNSILNGNTTIGIELGSTRIKTVLVGPEHEILASGSHEWENENIDGIWT